MATRIKGVDISTYQKGIPFDEIKKAGVQFALIRAGFGKIKDSQLDIFVSECKKHGIKYGFYWYSYALTVDRAKEEAEACISAIKQYKPDYPVYYDIEDKSQIGQLTTRTRTDMCHAFCDTIRKAGYTAGIYANPSSSIANRICSSINSGPIFLKISFHDILIVNLSVSKWNSPRLKILNTISIQSSPDDKDAKGIQSISSNACITSWHSSFKSSYVELTKTVYFLFMIIIIPFNLQI